MHPWPARSPGCNPDFDVWNVGTRSIWNPVPNLDVGLEVMYTKLEHKHELGATRSPGRRSRGRPLRAVEQDVCLGLFRIQRNFWP